MSEGWEYSDGGSEEFTHAMQLRLGLPRHGQLAFFNTKESEEAERKRMRDIMVYNHVGKPIRLQDGMYAIETSLAWLKEHGLESKKLQKNLELLGWTEDMLDQGFYQ